MATEILVQDDDAGQRLDRWLKARDVPFAGLQKALRTGEIRVNSKRVDGAVRLVAGDKVRLPPQLQPDAAKAPAPNNKAVLKQWQSLILFEDDSFVALNKPAGLATQGGTGQKRSVDSLAQLAFPTATPKLVHRLDKDTSGVLLLAKSRAAAAALAAQFAEHTAQKTYWAAVLGTVSKTQGVIRAGLSKGVGGAQLREMMLVDYDAEILETEYTVLARARELCWLALKPREGRTHQLRVHCASKNMPIYGDGKYGTAERGVRLHLHARRLSLEHPLTGRRLELTAPLPPHMLSTWGLCGWDDGATPTKH